MKGIRKKWIILSQLINDCVKTVSYTHLATAVVPSVPASAEQTDIWQVNGKYTLTKKKLVTYCALYSADSGMKKKKRTFKITSATKFIHVTPSYNKKKIKKSQIGKYIKTVSYTHLDVYKRQHLPHAI